jgi:hypothetical protein
MSDALYATKVHFDNVEYNDAPVIIRHSGV